MVTKKDGTQMDADFQDFKYKEITKKIVSIFQKVKTYLVMTFIKKA